MDDDASRAIARRRERRWLWTPAIVTFVMVLAGSFVTVEYDVKVWYYDQADLARTPLRERRATETDRAFGFNLMLFRGGLFFQKPPNWVEVVERKVKAVRISIPDDLEPFWFVGLMPAVGLFLVYLPARTAIARIGAGGRLFTAGGLRVRQSLRSYASLLAVPLGVALIAWFFFSAAFGVGTLLLDSYALVLFNLMFLALALWSLGSLSPIMLVYHDRARIVFLRRLLWCIALIPWIAGVPVASAALLIRIL